MSGVESDNVNVTKSLSSLSSTKGKKLLWTELDSENEIFYLLFEGGTLISVSEVVLIEDSKSFIERYLADKLSGANRIKELEALSKPQETPNGSGEPTEASVEEVGEAAPAEPESGGGSGAAS